MTHNSNFYMTEIIPSPVNTTIEENPPIGIQYQNLPDHISYPVHADDF